MRCHRDGGASVTVWNAVTAMPIALSLGLTSVGSFCRALLGLHALPFFVALRIGTAAPNAGIAIRWHVGRS